MVSFFPFRFSVLATVPESPFVVIVTFEASGMTSLAPRVSKPRPIVVVPPQLLVVFAIVNPKVLTPPSSRL